MTDKPTVLVTHTDLDGAGCAVVWDECCGYPGPIAFVDHDTVDETVLRLHREGYDRIVCADIAPSAVLRTMFRDSLAIIDHHATTGPVLHGIVDVTKCATRLLFEYMERHSSSFCRKRGVEQFIEEVEAFDLWKLDSPHRDAAERQQLLLSLFGLEHYLNLRVWTKATSMTLLTDALIRQRDLAVSEAVARARFKDGIAYVSANENTSAIGGELTKGAPVAVVVSFKWRTVSLRSSGEVDVSAIAQAQGGGGHHNAAGYPLTLDEALRLTAILFEREPEAT